MVSKLLSAAVTAVSSFYRLFGGRLCRFHPSCSAYAQDALGSRPAGQALRLILKRLLRCHPLSPGGYDPVPPARP